MENRIKVVRGVCADEENGGKLIGGVIIGPKLNTCRWQIEDDHRLYSDRAEAEAELKKRDMHKDIYNAMFAGLPAGTHLAVSEVIRMILDNAKSLRAVLGAKKYASLM